MSTPKIKKWTSLSIPKMGTVGIVFPGIKVATSINRAHPIVNKYFLIITKRHFASLYFQK